MSSVNFQKIEDHPDGAVRLFKIMMRLEYALKGKSPGKLSITHKCDLDRAVCLA
jgi:hypothetical protein